MTGKLSACIGPLGAVIHHSRCPGRTPTIQPGVDWLICGCECHQGPETED